MARLQPLGHLEFEDSLGYITMAVFKWLTGVTADCQRCRTILRRPEDYNPCSHWGTVRLGCSTYHWVLRKSELAFCSVTSWRFWETHKWVVFTPEGANCPWSLEIVGLDLVTETHVFFPLCSLELMHTSCKSHSLRSFITNNTNVCRIGDGLAINCLHFAMPTWTKS